MKNEFTFNRGEWLKTDTLPDRLDDEAFDSWRSRAGIGECVTHLGHGSLVLCMYEVTGTGSYFSELCLDGVNVEHAVMANLPSMLMFIKDYAPLVYQALTHDWQHEVKRYLGTAFTVWHGHSIDRLCKQCDK
ncbi:MAG: hypothetical protein HOP23_03995 [Methylococcaceae bacterium]|nr:hypothetical protein [Methylococcaceae bacterium]